MTHMKIIGTPLYQWEIGRKLQIIPILGMTVDFVHFSNQGDAEALSVKPKEIDGIVVADIPDILLQSGRHLVVHSVNVSDGCVETIRDCVLPVRKRAKPSDYIYTEPEKMTWEALDERIKVLEESPGGSGGASVELDTTLTKSGKAADAKAVGDALSGKQPAGNYATKDEIPAIPATLPNPNKLTFSGAVSAEYDGSAAVEVMIPQGGGGASEEVWEDVCNITIGADVYAQHILTAAEGKKYKKLEVCIANNQTKKARIVFSSSGGEYGPPPDTYQSAHGSIAYALNWTPTNTYGRWSMYPVADTFFECSFFVNAGAATSWNASNTKTYEPVWSDDSQTSQSENKWRGCYRGGGIDQISIYSTDTATPITSGCRVIIKGVRF